MKANNATAEILKKFLIISLCGIMAFIAFCFAGCGSNSDPDEQEQAYQANVNILKTILNGQNLSILGDSISTFIGYSNDAVNTNNTIGDNATHYRGNNYVTSVDQTWWKLTVDQVGLNLLVNNSYSGDKVTTRGQTRCVQLHDNTGNNGNIEINPNIIAVYLGINDFDGNVLLENFKTSYRAMIRSMVEKYPSADVFLFTLLPNSANSRTINDLEEFNNVIKTVANENSLQVVDLYADSGITNENKATYMGDSSALHPNELGMAAMAKCFINKLISTYID